MRKSLFVTLAVLLATALAAPAFAVEFDYGGYFRARMQHSDNMFDAQDKRNGEFDDQAFWIDQRTRMYFTFIASERLQLVTKWEVDTLWGNQASGGDSGSDSVNFEMKNAHIDFMIPSTPSRARVGVQGLGLLRGWVIDDDFSAARITTPLDPVTVDLGYIALQNEDVTWEGENIDAYYLDVAYAQGPFSLEGLFFYQYAHDTNVSTRFETSRGDNFGADLDDPVVEDNSLFNLGLQAGYSHDMFAANLIFIKNLGSYDYNLDGESNDTDYEGWMVEAGVDFFVQNFTFTLGGFFTSGDDQDDDDGDGAFRYPDGRSHYWAEIMGLGTLDVNVDGFDRLNSDLQGGYSSADAPSNIWTITAGAAWQALDTTKVTFNYWYLRTHEDVLADELTGEEDDSLGHEFDLYLDQRVVDGLMLRLVGAYLIADDGLTILADEDDIYEVGAQLSWSF